MRVSHHIDGESYIALRILKNIIWLKHYIQSAGRKDIVPDKIMILIFIEKH